MSSFWNRLTGGNEEAQAGEAPKVAAQSETVTTAPARKPGYGIAQANELMSKLPLSDNADLVVGVIRTTLESVGVQVGQLVVEAKSREGELKTQIDERRATIEELERRIETERVEIARIESELGVTTRTREGLERSEMLPGSKRPPAPRDSERPTVMAVESAEVVTLRNSEFESIPPSEPKLPTLPEKPSSTE
jgi:hypothetical protein